MPKHPSGVPAVVTLAASGRDVTAEGIPMEEACRQLEEAGATVVGLNCCRGPKTILPLMAKIRKVCKVKQATKDLFIMYII